MINLIKKSIIVTVILFGAFYGTAFAQVQNTDVALTINPTYPAPNQSVNATLSSFAVNLDKANISWSMNNKETLSGIGKKTFSFNTGDVGSSSVLSVRMNTLDGQNIVKTITITPTEVDMLWEAPDSYVPPFYKGKALVPSQGTFKVVAMPNLMTSIGKSSASNLSYTWTKDGNGQPNSSGWGKSYFIFKNNYLEKSNNIEVAISDITGNTSVSGSINLRTSIPKIIFYEKDLSLGTKWENSLGNFFTINPNGEILVAEPYFFSPKDITSDNLVFDWSLNGAPLQTPDPKNILSIKPESGKSGSAKINISVKNIQTLFQSLEKEINMNF